MKKENVLGREEDGCVCVEEESNIRPDTNRPTNQISKWRNVQAAVRWRKETWPGEE